MQINKILKKIEQANRNIGYFLIRLFFRNKPQTLPVDASKIKKLLIFRYDAIGDFVLTTPCLELLKKKLPGCEISVLASHRNYELSQNHPCVDKTYIYDGTIKSLFRCILALRKEKYNLIYAGVFDKTTFAGILANLTVGKSAIKLCIGHETRNKQYSTFFNVIILPAQRGTINMAFLMQLILIETFGWPEDAVIVKTTLGIDKSKNELVDNKLKNLKKSKKILYNISGRNTWKKEKHLEFAGLFRMEFPDYDLILSAIGHDREIAVSIKEKYGDDILYYQSGSVMELISLISKMDYIISPDTSIPHIAAALEIPVVDIYPLIGTTSIEEWTPLSKNSIVITTDGYQTIDFIEPQKVIDGFKQLLESTRVEF